MASYLRPRRGKEATAKSQNIVLKRGEIFFETPASGVGTGIGRLKMGDGSTSYASLPYFLKQLDLNDNNTKCAFTNVTAATSSQNNATYLNNIAPSNSLKTLFQNIKQLLLNYNSQLTSLNNDLNDPKKGLKFISDKYYSNGIVYREQNNTSLIYSHYDNGWYPISGNEPDHPCKGYGGIMITFHATGSKYVYIKLLILINNFIYVMSQDNSGNILSNFHRLSLV